MLSAKCSDGESEDDCPSNSAIEFIRKRLKAVSVQRAAHLIKNSRSTVSSRDSVYHGRRIHDSIHSNDHGGSGGGGSVGGGNSGSVGSPGGSIRNSLKQLQQQQQQQQQHRGDMGSLLVPRPPPLLMPAKVFNNRGSANAGSHRGSPSSVK